MLNYDVLTIIFTHAGIEDWSAICLSCKKFNELMQKVKHNYFLRLVPDPMFLPHEYKFQLINLYQSKKILKPIFNYNVKIDYFSFRRGYGGMSMVFKFNFPDIYFEYGYCVNGKMPNFYKNTLFTHDFIKIRSRITKFKNYDADSSYIRINNKLITEHDPNNYYLIPFDCLELETFTNIKKMCEKYPEFTNIHLISVLIGMGF